MAVSADYIFFTMRDAGTVSWASRIGGSVRVIAASQDRPMGIAIDSNNVYWVNQSVGNGGSVMKMPLFGGTPEALATSEAYPQDIAVDAANVYWNNFVYLGSIMKVPIAGGTKVPLASGPTMVNTYGMTIDGTNAYWTNIGDGGNTGSVMKVSLGGGTVTTLARNVDEPWLIGLFNGTVYFTTSGLGTQSVQKVSTAGGTVSTILAMTYATAFAVDATGLFLGVRNFAGNAILQLPLTGATMTILAQTKGIAHLALDANNVFWSTGVDMGFTAKAAP